MISFLKSVGVDEREDLEELLNADGLRPLLRWLEAHRENLVRDVLSYDLSNGNDRELALQKARLEGADKLIKSFNLSVQKAKSGKIKPD